MIQTDRLIRIRTRVREEAPLIHCLTNHITINDCANMVLAAGGKPIMAEHRAEVEEITGTAQALAMNLGNITDRRMESMGISARIAQERGIPSILDAVGTGCSRLRLEFAGELLSQNRVSVIKGNMSEIKALYGVPGSAKGIDAGAADMVRADNLEEVLSMAQNLANRYQAVVMITGAVDVITDGREAYLLENGCHQLSRVTGTGCMLNVLTAVFLSSGDIMGACVLGAALLGISGELAAESTVGIGSFKVRLFDALDTMEDGVFSEKIRIIEMKEMPVCAAARTEWRRE